MREEKQTFVEMLVGIVISTIVISAVGAFIAPDGQSYVLGTLLGGVFAAGVLCLMYRSIEKALALDEDSASKYTVKASMFRLVIMCFALMIGLVFPSIVNSVGIILGLLTLKACAYLQPLVHKVMVSKNIDKGR